MCDKYDLVTTTFRDVFKCKDEVCEQVRW